VLKNPYDMWLLGSLTKEHFSGYMETECILHEAEIASSMETALTLHKRIKRWLGG